MVKRSGSSNGNCGSDRPGRALIQLVARNNVGTSTAPVPPGKTPSGIYTVLHAECGTILGNIALLAKVSVTYLLEEYAQ